MKSTRRGGPSLFRSKIVFRSKGKQAIRNNLLVAKVIADMVRTSLGPKGMKKLLITKTGEIVTTADGAFFLKKMDFSLIFDHPIANILVEAAKSQDKNIGDGTSTVVVLIGELAWKARSLIEIGLHPHSIISGYKAALGIALKKLQEIAKPVQINPDTLRALSATSISGKDPELAASSLPTIIADAFMNILEKEPNGAEHADIDRIKILKAPGGSVLESKLIKGVVIDEKVAHPLMPKRVTSAKIALLNEPLELRRRKDSHTFLTSANIVIDNPAKMSEFIAEEEAIIQEKVKKLITIGANVVLTPKRIDDLAKSCLAKAGVLAVERIRTTDIPLLMRVCGGRVVADIDDLSRDDLGYADIIEERLIGDKRWVFVLNERGKGAASIILRGSSDRQLNDLEEIVQGSLKSLTTILKEPKIVPGGGATEMALATAVRREAVKYPGKEQLAITFFAASLERVATALAENAGLDPIDILTSLRVQHESGKHHFGIDLQSGKVDDMLKLGIVEPFLLKEHMLKTAYEGVSIILRIGEVITMPEEDDKKRKK